MMPTQAPRSALALGPTLAFAAGLLLLYVAERLIGGGAWRVALDAVGGAAVIGGLVWRSFLAWRASGEARRFASAQAACMGGVVVGLALYAAHLYAFSVAAESRWPAILYAGFFLLLGCGSAPLAALEILAAPMRRADFVEWRRARAALASGLVLALAFAFLLGVNYAAERRNFRRDLSFGAPTSPSEATLALVRTSERPVELYLFLPRGNRLLAEVEDYFRALASEGVRLQVLDQAVDPDLAEELKVTANGYVAARSGERHAKWYLGTELETSRSRIKRLDREVRKLLAQLTVPERNVYFTSGHGERPDGVAGKGEAPGGKILRDLVRSLNAKVRTLGLAEGLGGKVPDDADLVVVFGPTSKFFPEEVASLVEYARRGGSLLLMLEPGVESGLGPLLDELGVELDEGVVCSDRLYVQATHTPADRAFVVTNAVTRHEAVKALNSARSRAAILLRRAGHLKVKAGADPRPSVVLRAMPGSFADLDGDYEYDTGKERRRSLALLAVVEGKGEAVEGEGGADAHPGRAAVLADADALADGLVINRANYELGYGLVTWLLGDEKLGAEVEPDKDVPVRHTRESDVVWFYGTIFAMPALVLAGGLTFVYGKRRRRRR